MWVEVCDYPNYEVSENGVIRNKNTKYIMKPKHHHNKYLTVCLTKSVGKYENVLIHRIVAKAFIPNPNNYNIVNHKDENPANNKAENLEWCTQKQNCNYGTRNSKISYSRQIPVVKIGKDCITIYGSGTIAAKLCGVGQTSISQVVTHKRKSLFGDIWRFATPEEIKALGTKDFIILNNSKTNIKTSV